MPQIKISQLGQFGVINDPPRYSIPPNALSDGQNIRLNSGRISNFGGREKVTTPDAANPGDPIEVYGLFLFQAPNRDTLWVEAGLNKVYVYTGLPTHSDITRLSGDYAMAEYTGRWTGGIQQTMGVLCNGHSDAPQMWKEVSQTVPLEDMIYDINGTPGADKTWADLDYTAYAMRPFKNTFFALNLRRAGAEFPSTVQWCDFIAPGAVETDWVPRADNSAGEVSLGESTGNIIDAAPLRDDLIIYKEDAVFRCSFTGIANDPFQFQRLPDYVRIINRGCIGVAGEFHVLASRDDVVIFDGNTFRSILSDRMREYYQTRMFPEQLFRTFVTIFNAENEAWICLPTTGNVGESKSPDLAIVWNYKNDTISLTDLPQVRDMDQGLIVGDIPDAFDDDTLTIDDDTARFDQSPFERARDSLAGAHGTEISIFGRIPTDNSTPRVCVAERLGLTLTDPKHGYPSTDRVHTLRAIKPYIQSTGPVDIQVGAQTSAGAPVLWESVQPYNPSTQEELQFRSTGRYFAWRIRSEANVEWNLTDLEFEYQLRRKR